jgi:peptide/nickel transport system substrate-binding protein
MNMSRSSRRTALFAWTLIIALLLPILAACGQQATEPQASPSPAAETEASPPAETEASPPAETEASPPAETEETPEATPEEEETPEAGGGAAPQPAESPINEKTFIAAYNQNPDTLFWLESTSAVVSYVLAGTGQVSGGANLGSFCNNNLSYDYQPNGWCYAEFPTFENGGAVTETVQIDQGQISEDNPIVVEGVLVTDTAIAAEEGIQIPDQLPQLTLAFDLNQDLWWQDGDQVTADDAVEMFRVLKDPDLQLASRYTIDRIQNVEAQDDFTVVQTYVPGYLEYAYWTTFAGFMPEHITSGLSVAEIRDEFGGGNPSFAFGPYMIEGHDPGAQTTLVSNPYWQGDGPNIGTTIFKYVAEADQLLTQLETGEIDYAGTIGLTLAQIPTLEDLEARGVAELQSVPSTVWEHLDLTLERGGGEEAFFDDVRVRQAVAYGINRQQIVDEVLFGRTNVMNTYVPSEHPSYPGDEALEAYEYNPDRARELLEEAGWTDTDGDGIREKDGRPLSVQFYTTEGQAQRAAAAQVIENNLRDVGMEVNLNFVPGPEVLFLNTEEGILTGRRFDIGLYAWVAGVEPSHLLYVSEQCPGPANNWTGQNNPCYRNPEFDRAARRALSEIDPERKQELDHEPLTIFNRDLPALPLFQRVQLVAYDPAVTGINMDPTSSVEIYNIHEIDIEE